MLGPGEPLPAARVWVAPRADPVPLAEAVAGDGDALLCFYPFDWSPTCTSELRLLEERADDLAAAGVRPLGISLDTPWSQRAFGEALGLRRVRLLSDRLGEAAGGCGVLREAHGLPYAERSALLVRGDTVVASWLLGPDLPDLDAIVAAASSR